MVKYVSKRSLMEENPLRNNLSVSYNVLLIESFVVNGYFFKNKNFKYFQSRNVAFTK